MRDISIYFDGTNIHFGTLLQPEKDVYLFVNLDKNAGTYLSSDRINIDFKKGHAGVMVLKDAIIGNVYGVDRNRGLENAGLEKTVRAEKLTMEDFEALAKLLNN